MSIRIERVPEQLQRVVLHGGPHGEEESYPWFKVTFVRSSRLPDHFEVRVEVTPEGERPPLRCFSTLARVSKEAMQEIISALSALVGREEPR